MSKKILVTGATGQIGGEVVRQLRAKDENVRAAVRNPIKAREIDIGGAMLVHWDYNKRDTFAPALTNVEKLVLVAPSANPNVDSDLNPAIDEAKNAGVKHIVLNSAFGVDSSDEIPLRKVEKHLQASGIDYTILRPNWFMQNFASWYSSSIKEGAIYLPAGDAKTSFIDVRDIAAVVCKAVSDNIHLNKEYTLTGNEALNHSEVASKISTIIGKDVKHHDISEEQFKEALKAAGYDAIAIEMMVELYGTVKAGYTAGITNDVEQILGKTPITFGEFAKDHASAWQ